LAGATRQNWWWHTSFSPEAETILFNLSSANRVKNFWEMTVSTFIMNKKILPLMMTRLGAGF